jgi:hypothetical protein
MTLIESGVTIADIAQFKESSFAFLMSTLITSLPPGESGLVA